MEQQAYYQLTGWGWVGLLYFFGVLITFMYAMFTMDDLIYSKRKKFSWGALLIVLFFAAFSWFGFVAISKFDNKHNRDIFR